MRCCGCRTVVFGRGEMAANPIRAMRRRTRLRPTSCPCRRRWRIICREPDQGVSRNWPSISRMMARGSGLSFCGPP
jgi:hypothetical protein